MFYITTPQDDGQVRASLYSRAELKPLQKDYTKTIESRLLILTLDTIPTIFGPKLQTVSNSWSFPNREKYPEDIELPIFGHGNVFVVDSGNVNDMTLSGVSTANNADLYAVRQPWLH